MSKTIKGSIKQWILKKKLSRRGVAIHNNTVINRVNFLGNAVIEPYCRLSGDPEITIGDNFYMNSGCHLLGNIIIGRDVMVGPKSVFWGRDHSMKIGSPMKNQPHIKRDIVIGDDVWIAANVTILKGVVIGNGVVIGAGSVVTKNIPNYAIALGNPAKIVRYRL